MSQSTEPFQANETDDAIARKDGWQSAEHRRQFHDSVTQLSQSIQALADKLMEESLSQKRRKGFWASLLRK